MAADGSRLVHDRHAASPGSHTRIKKLHPGLSSAAEKGEGLGSGVKWTSRRSRYARRRAAALRRARSRRARLVRMGRARLAAHPMITYRTRTLRDCMKASRNEASAASTTSFKGSGSAGACAGTKSGSSLSSIAVPNELAPPHGELIRVGPTGARSACEAAHWALRHHCAIPKPCAPETRRPHQAPHDRSLLWRCPPPALAHATAPTSAPASRRDRPAPYRCRVPQGLTPLERRWLRREQPPRGALVAQARWEQSELRFFHLGVQSSLKPLVTRRCQSRRSHSTPPLVRSHWLGYQRCDNVRWQTSCQRAQSSKSYLASASS
eukprot:scaffold19253_cov124-Isochrysis_galbana.AAC.3